MAENCVQLRGPDLSARTEEVFAKFSEEYNGCDIQNNMRQL